MLTRKILMSSSVTKRVSVCIDDYCELRWIKLENKEYVFKDYFKDKVSSKNIIIKTKNHETARKLFYKTMRLYY